MADDRKRPEAPRGEKVLPGVWRLRLPLPWPGVPHGNVWAVAADGGIVLFDTGIGGKGRMRQLDLALAQAGFGLEDVRLLVCTHSHTDHYGLAGADRRGRRLRALDAPRLGARAPARRRPGGGARAADRGGAPERRPAGGAGALPRVAQRRRRDRDRRDRRARPRPRCPGSRSRPTSAPGRSTRRPATRPRTSSCTSPSASC